MSKVNELLAEIRRKSEQSLQVTGPSEISGEAHVQGSKNAANKLVGVALALPGKYRVQNFPLILDPLELLSVLETLGGKVELSEDNTVLIETTNVNNKPIPYDLTKNTTGAFGFAGALLGRFGEVRIGKPGGDKIGHRPVDLHTEALESLGASIVDGGREIEGKLGVRPLAKHFRLKMPSTGAAVNYVLAVAASRGSAKLENAPIDGDMDVMYQMMRAAGVEVETKGHVVSIDASKFEPPDSTIDFTCSSDRNDAFTWLAYGAISQRGLRISGLPVHDVEHGLEVLESVGVRISERDKGSLFVQAPPQNTTIPAGRTIVAGLAGEFHSDWAPLLEVVLSRTGGNYRVVDTLFSNRVRQAELLREMGADVTVSGGPPPEGIKLHFSADPGDARYIFDIHGPAQLRAIDASVGYDVRACAAMVMAASQADGISTLSDMKALYRGYENIVERLRAVGIDIS